MEKNSAYPWGGCGTDKDITGCRFSLSVMSDDYVPIILSAVEGVNTAHVWSATDALSTIYRGKRIHVVDAIQGFFAKAYRPDKHITLEATFSKGCPGDVEEDAVLMESDVLLNPTDKSFPVRGKIAFYPLGVVAYMDHIAYVVRLAMEKKLYKNASHYASELEGDVSELFAYFNEVLAYAEENIEHYVLQATLSVNSPTKTN